MPAITDLELLDYFSAEVRKNQPALVPQWTPLATRANQRAWNQIIGLLAARGYSLAQITAADQTKEWNYSQGLYWLLTLASATENTGYTPAQIDKFSIIEELKDPFLALTSNGAVVNPLGPAGQPSTGAIAGESDAAMQRREQNDLPSWACDQGYGW